MMTPIEIEGHIGMFSEYFPLLEVFIQRLKTIGEYIHGLLAIPFVLVAIYQWIRLRVLGKEVKEKDLLIEEKDSLINRIKQAAEQQNEETIWQLSPPAPPKGFPERIGGLGLPIIAVGNLKGGVGKTTTTAYLAHCLAKAGKRVLVVDLDYQGSLSSIFSNTDTDSSAVNNLLETPTHQIIFSNGILTEIPSLFGRLSIVTASSSLSALENRLQLRWLLEKDNDDVRYRLAHQFANESLAASYDLIILDTPPRMTISTFNAFTCCSHVLIPTSLKVASWSRVWPMLRLLENIKTVYNPTLKPLGIALTLTQWTQTLTAGEQQAKQAFVNQLAAQGLQLVIFERHIPRLNSFADFEFQDIAVQIYDRLAAEIWEEIGHEN